MEDLKTEIVSQEINYIQSTINQSINDRYQMLNFYITITGAFASVIIGLFSFGQVTEATYIGAAIVSFVSGVLGIIFWLKFLRLRQAWRESLIAFNKLKSHVLGKDSGLKTAFLWSGDTIPRLDKVYTIHYYSALVVFILMMASFVISLVFAFRIGTPGAWLFGGMIMSSILMYVLHYLLYKIAYANS